MTRTLKTLMLSVTMASLPLALSACSTPKTTQTLKKETTMSDLKQTALKAQDALFKDFDAEAVKQHFNADYIQHNPGVPTGLEPILGFIPGLKQSGISVKTHRVLQDGDFIILHNTYDNAQAFGGKELVAFDVWRMQDGKVAEHWDNLQPIVTETASGRSQFDGPTEVTDLDKTDANKAVIAKFAEDILMGKNPNNVTEYISTEQYDQHNPAVKDGLAGFGEAVEFLTSQNDMFVYKKVHKILGEGNFVLAMSEGEWHGKPQAFYDLFRLDNGKIVEHWDVIAEIPAEMAHSNGKF